MAIVLQDKSLEDKLIELSKEFHIKTEDLLKQFVQESIEQLTNKKKFNIDSSHIELVDSVEKEDILQRIKNTPSKDKVIDERYTQVFEI